MTGSATPTRIVLLLAAALLLLLTACTAPTAAPTTQGGDSAALPSVDGGYPPPGEEKTGPDAYPAPTEAAAPQGDPAGGGTGAYPMPALSGEGSNVLFVVYLPDGNSVNVSSEALVSLPLQSASLNGEEVGGPKLSDVLLLAGIQEYQQVVVEAGDAAQTLTPDQVTDQTLLDLPAGEGGLRLVSPDFSADQWLGPITAIRVQ